MSRLRHLVQRGIILLAFFRFPNGNNVETYGQLEPQNSQPRLTKPYHSTERKSPRELCLNPNATRLGGPIPPISMAALRNASTHDKPSDIRKPTMPKINEATISESEINVYFKTRLKNSLRGKSFS
jgi:hypothetical protein